MRQNVKKPHYLTTSCVKKPHYLTTSGFKVLQVSKKSCNFAVEKSKYSFPYNCVKEIIRYKMDSITELPWWQSIPLGAVYVTAWAVFILILVFNRPK